MRTPKTASAIVTAIDSGTTLAQTTHSTTRETLLPAEQKTPTEPSVPGEVDQQLVEAPREEIVVRALALSGINQTAKR